jgi:MFS family permease
VTTESSYAVLLGSAVLAIAALVAGRRAFPVPERLEQAKTTRPKKFGRAYWLYMTAGGCFAAGLLSFELMTFHLARSHLVATSWIPALLALSTGLGVLASLALGKLFDRFGTLVVGVAVVVSAPFAPLAFSNDRVLLIVAMLPWGVGYATQDTLFKAIVAGLLPEGKRNLAFALFYAGYGVG